MVSSGTGLRKKSAAADSPTPGYERRPVGRQLVLIWLVGAAVIPLLIAAIGYVVFGGSGSESAPVDGATTTTSMSSRPGGSGLALAPLSIFRAENNITVSGDLPDDAAKAALIGVIKDALGQDINIGDQIHINPAVKALEFAKAGPLFKAAAPIPDFSLVVDSDTITLTGSPPTTEVRNAVNQAAAAVWPNLNVVDKMDVKAPSPGAPAPSSSAPASTTSAAPTTVPGFSLPALTPGASAGATPGATPATTPTTTSAATTTTSSAAAPAAPAAPPPDPCANLQAVVNAITGGPVTFGNDGVSLTPTVQQTLSQVADRLKACSTARVTVNGYTDNSGSEAINIPLSQQRATTVADYLVSQGVARDHVAAKGLGSTGPIADNDTSEGRAKNRRAEIVVS